MSTLMLIAAAQPETSSILRSDFSPITAARPARAGETLVLMATGLGPTNPGIDPGHVFPVDSLQPVNSPLEVKANGVPADILNAIGYPGVADKYRIDRRVPAAISPGTATVQLSAAWVAGPAVDLRIEQSN